MYCDSEQVVPPHIHRAEATAKLPRLTVASAVEIRASLTIPLEGLNTLDG
jgi:hypothetical protein